MIRFISSQDGKGLFVSIEPGYPLKKDTPIDFYRQCASEVEQALLQQHLRQELGDLMEGIREALYNAGWRDAKSHKKAKRTCFATATRVLDWEKQP